MNGQPVPPEDATVSVFDRGFLYGDSVYEVIRTYDGLPFELNAHVDRLVSSAQRIGMRLPVSRAAMTDEVAAAVAIADLPDAYIRIVVTRGAGPIGLDPGLAVNPIRLVIVQPLNPPSPEMYEKGVTVAVTSVRRNLKGAIDPNAKTGNYLNSVLALSEARKRQAYEAIMLDHRDLITEGSSSNVFAVLGDRLVTPPLEVGILAGITRSVVLKIAAEAGLKALEAPLSVTSLTGADEVLIHVDDSRDPSGGKGQRQGHRIGKARSRIPQAPRCLCKPRAAAQSKYLKASPTTDLSRLIHKSGAVFGSDPSIEKVLGATRFAAWDETNRGRGDVPPTLRPTRRSSDARRAYARRSVWRCGRRFRP